MQNDLAAFAVLNRGHFSGVFQFSGSSVARLTQKIEVTCFDDMVALVALGRPGPMESGASEKWIKRKNGDEPVFYQHPSLEPFLKKTYGLILYQEQIMQITRQIGGMSWEDVTGLRRVIGKSQGPKAIERYEQKFMAGAITNGLSQIEAQNIWSDIAGFGGYGFVKAHAVAYATVAYRCCWLKAHHPIEFAAATLDAEKDPAKQIALLRELSLEGVDYIPVDPEHSDIKWSIKTEGDRKTLVGPLTQIKGIGPASVQEILDARRHGKLIRAALMKRLTAAKTEIDTLFPVRDAIKRLHPNLTDIGIVSTPVPIKEAQCGVQGEIMILAVANRIAPLSENEPQKVAKRNGKILSGPTQALNLFMRDDTDEIFAKVNCFNYERLGKPIVERGRAGAALYALKGSVWSGFRGLNVTAVRFLGFLDE